MNVQSNKILTYRNFCTKADTAYDTSLNDHSMEYDIARTSVYLAVPKRVFFLISNEMR